MAEVSSARNCGSYWPGHDVHWIQANKVMNEPGEVVRARVLGAEGDVIVVEVDGELRRYLNHDAARIERLAASYGGRAVHVKRWRVLAIPGDQFGVAFSLDESKAIGALGGSYLFYVATERDWQPCPTRE